MAALGGGEELSATALAQSGATLLHRALGEMFLGEPENLRRVAWRIAEARPTIVAVRNIGVAAFTTAKEARVGDRMAAATRSTFRLARLLEATPQSLGRRTQASDAGPCRHRRVFARGSRSDRRGCRAVENGCGSLTASQEAPNWRGGCRRAESRRSWSPGDMASQAVQSAEVVLLGCSALLADGSVIAPRGSSAVARAASDRSVPVQVLADTLKLAPWLPRRASEDQTWEVTPPTLIEHVATEDGIRRPHQLLAAARDLSVRWRSFEEARAV